MINKLKTFGALKNDRIVMNDFHSLGLGTNLRFITVNQKNTNRRGILYIENYQLQNILKETSSSEKIVKFNSVEELVDNLLICCKQIHNRYRRKPFGQDYYTGSGIFLTKEELILLIEKYEIEKIKYIWNFSN